MRSPAPARIGIVCVGTELLRGRLNTHQSWLSRKLASAGLFAYKECSLPDDRRLIAEELRRYLRDCDALIVCGGLGPTFDDVTREAVADALGRALVYRPRLFEEIRRKLLKHAMSVPEENKRQAFVIEGAEVLPNPLGSAPGQLVNFRIGRSRRLIVMLPGPASEMEPMFERQALPRLARAFAVGAVRHWAIRLFGLSESAADERLAPVTARAGPAADFTILASAGQVEYHVTVHASQAARADKTLAEIRRQVYALVGDHAFGEEADTLESACGDFLRRAGRTLAVAESCTGGQLGERLTRTPGSSDYFQGGVIAYSNDLKRRLLGVDRRTLSDHGAVSAECAAQMARGARRLCRADIGLSITGIAGPGGGTKSKPVGLVFVALSFGNKTLTRELRLPGNRESIRIRAASQALGLLLSLFRRQGQSEK